MSARRSELLRGLLRGPILTSALIREVHLLPEDIPLNEKHAVVLGRRMAGPKRRQMGLQVACRAQVSLEAGNDDCLAAHAFHRRGCVDVPVNPDMEAGSHLQTG